MNNNSTKLISLSLRFSNNTKVLFNKLCHLSNIIVTHNLFNSLNNNNYNSNNPYNKFTICSKNNDKDTKFKLFEFIKYNL